MQALLDPETLQPAAAEACARCDVDALDECGFCLFCGAVTVAPGRYVAGDDPETRLPAGILAAPHAAGAVAVQGARGRHLAA